MSSIIMALIYAAFALFVYRLNSGKSVEPKFLFCVVPAIVYVFSTLVISVLLGDVATYYSYSYGTVIERLLGLLLVGGYCWAVSTAPVGPVVYQDIQNTQPMA